MTRHYSTRDFFRQMPNALLARYFAARGVLADFDFAAMKETRIEPLFGAWMALREAQRARMEADLREVADVSNEKGVKAIIDEALFHMEEESENPAFVALLMELPDHHDRAMIVFLGRPNLWRGATRFHQPDTRSYWRKRKNLRTVPAAVEMANLRRWDAALGADAPHARKASRDWFVTRAASHCIFLGVRPVAKVTTVNRGAGASCLKPCECDNVLEGAAPTNPVEVASMTVDCLPYLAATRASACGQVMQGQFQSLTKPLEEEFVHSLSDLRAALRQRVEMECFPFPWDLLSPSNVAALHNAKITRPPRPRVRSGEPRGTWLPGSSRSKPREASGNASAQVRQGTWLRTRRDWQI